MGDNDDFWSYQDRKGRPKEEKPKDTWRETKKIRLSDTGIQRLSGKKPKVKK